MTEEGKSLKESIMEAQEMQEKIMKLKNKKHDLKLEIRQLRERVDELEQRAEKDRKVILMLLQISDHLLNYVNDTAKHVKQLENKEEAQK